jgi:hypothetical protein
VIPPEHPSQDWELALQDAKRRRSHVVMVVVLLLPPGQVLIQMLEPIQKETRPAAMGHSAEPQVLNPSEQKVL